MKGRQFHHVDRQRGINQQKKRQISESLWEIKMRTMGLDVKVCMWPESDLLAPCTLAIFKKKSNNPPLLPLIALSLL